MKRIRFTLLLLFLITTAFSQEKNQDYREAFRIVEVWLEAQKDFEKLPGLSAIVIDDQQVLWSGAFGLSNVEQNLRTGISTRYSICSISKLFTAVAIMKLYDEGKLRLDDQIADLLPDFKLQQKYEVSAPITVRTLLTHASGIPGEAAYPYWTGPEFPFPGKDEILSKLSEQETLYPASTYYQYSNLGFALLGEIVAVLSGVPYEEYIQQNIFTPLGLSETQTDLPEQLYGNELAIGYSALTRKGSREKVNYFRANGMTSSAGFSSNVLDLGKFASWQFRLRDTTVTEILKPSTMKYMHNVHWTDPDWNTTWGLGFYVYKGPDGTTYVSHGGNCPGYRSVLIMNLKMKRAFAVMINANGTHPPKYVDGIEEIMKKAEVSKNGDTASDKTELKRLREYTGFYNQMPWWSEQYVSTWNGGLVTIDLPTEKPGDSMTFYKHIEGDTFRRIRDNGDLGESLVFERDENNRIVRYTTHGTHYNKMER